MNNIPTTSKENTENELEKIIPPKLMKNFDCVILLLPKKNQEEPSRLIELVNDEMDSQLSVSSSNDNNESDLIDFFSNTTDTDTQNAPEPDATSQALPLPIDVDELEKLYLKLSEEKSKKSFAGDHCLNSKTTETKGCFDTSKIIEIDDTPKPVFPKLKRACSEPINPDNKFDGKILIPKLNRKISETSTLTTITDKSEILGPTLRHLLKTDTGHQMDTKSEILSTGLKRSVSETPHNLLSNFDRYSQNTKYEVVPKLIPNKSLTENNESKCPQNPIPRLETSEMSDIYRLDTHPERGDSTPIFENVYKVEDFDESYDDLHDNLSLYKRLGRMTLTSKTIEPVQTSTSLTQLESVKENNSKVQYPYKYVDKLLNNRTPTNAIDPVIPKPALYAHSTQPWIRKSIEQFNTEAENTYINKLLNSRNKIQTPLMYYDPKNFYEPDPRNIEECILIIQPIKKDNKQYNKKRIITSETDRAKFIEGPDFIEKQHILPQIMNKLMEKKARLDKEKNVQKRLILGSTPIQSVTDDIRYNAQSISQVYKSNTPVVTSESSSVRLNPVVLNEDCNKERLKALKKRQMFDYFVQTGNYI